METTYPSLVGTFVLHDGILGG